MTLFREQPQLLVQFRAGDRRALGLVYCTYFRDIFALARRGFTLKSGKIRSLPGISKSDERADFVQDVFVKAFSSNARAGFDGVRPYRPYLLQIARNVRMDQLRRAHLEMRLTREQEEAHDALWADLPFSRAPDTAPDAWVPEDEYWWQSHREATLEFLAQLPCEQQQFVQLRFVEERSQYEIAEHLKVTRRRVRTLESSVRRALRQHLQQRELDRSGGRKVTRRAEKRHLSTEQRNDRSKRIALASGNPLTGPQ